MRRRLRLIGRPVAGIAVAAALAAVAASHAAAGTYAEPDRVLVATTGSPSELTTTLPIYTAPGVGRRVVMSLPASALGRLAFGDRLLSSSELEVTTDCLAKEARCVGTPYDYDPTVSAQLILAPSASATGGPDTTALSGIKRQPCLQRLPNREHHCTLAFMWPALNLATPLPTCFPASCYVNLVADAYSPQAQPGNVLLVGEDEPDGSIGQGKGRVNAIRIRPNAPGPAPQGRVTGAVTRAPAASQLEIGRQSDLNETVVFSRELPHLQQGDQLAVWAKLRTDISQLPYNVLVHSKLIVTGRPDATRVTHLAKQVVDMNGELTEGNGFNCTAATTPCTTTKAGVGSMVADARDRTGQPVPLYVNLVTGTMAKRASASPGDAATVLDGWLRVRRYPASRHG